MPIHRLCAGDCENVNFISYKFVQKTILQNKANQSSISKINKWIGKLFWLRQNILQKCNKNGPIKSQPLFAYFLLFSSNIFTEKTADFCIIQTRIVILGKKNTDH